MPLENLIERLQFVRQADKLTRLLIDQTVNINVKVRSEQNFFYQTNSQIFTAKFAFIYRTICG